MQAVCSSFCGARVAAKTTSTSTRTARRSVVVRAESTDLAKVERVQKVGGLYVNTTDSTALTYLTGELPGDFGFDPLGLCLPDNDAGFINRSWLSYSEVFHCRWAMLGAAGCIAPEILATSGIIPGSVEEFTWFRSGVVPPLGSYDNYWVDPYTLFFIEAMAMNFAELKRYQDYKNPGSQGKQYFLGLEAVMGGSGNPAYPGGQFFNLFNLGKTEAEMKKLKTNEIRNGRLAMIAFLGFASQAAVRGKGPIECLNDHIADPGHVNIYTSSVGKESIVTVVLLCIIPMIIEAVKTGNQGKETVPYFPWTSPWDEK